MKKWYSFLVVIIAASIGSSFMNSAKGDLYVQLKNIRNSNGVLYIFLYNYEDQYPKSPLTYYTVQKNSIINGQLKVRINDIYFRENYAITLIDDENGNDDLDRILGIPTEGFGFSNNVRPLISLPDYTELLFNFKDEKTINIELQYFL